MNLVELIKGELGSNTISKLSETLSMDAGDARRATDAATPALLAAMTGLASTPDGARRLDAAVDDLDDRIDPVAALSSGGSSFLEGGSKAASSLFGSGTLSSIVSGLGKFTQLRSGLIMPILGLLMPIVLGKLRRQKSSLGLDAGGLAGLLNSQKHNIAGAMPAGLSGMMNNVPGLNDLSEWSRGAGARAAGTADDAADWARDTGARAPDRARDTASTAYQGGRSAVTHASRTHIVEAPSPARWIIPLILALGLGGLLWWWAASNRDRDIPTAARDTVDRADPTGRDTARDGSRAAQDAANTARAGTDDATLAAARLADEQFTKLQTGISDTFSGATESLSGITDAASADRAVIALQELPDKLDSFRTDVQALPPERRRQLNQELGTWAEKLNAELDKAMANPAIGDKIRPYAEPVREKLMPFLPTTRPSA